MVDLACNGKATRDLNAQLPEIFPVLPLIARVSLGVGAMSSCMLCSRLRLRALAQSVFHRQSDQTYLIQARDLAKRPDHGMPSGPWLMSCSWCLLIAGKKLCQ